MNLKFPSREKRKTLPIHPDIILLLLLFPVSSVQILKVKSLFVYSGQEAGCSDLPCQALIRASFIVDL